MLLSEVPNAMQYEAARRRRWFQNEFFDLYVWETSDGIPVAFQLCYAKADEQRALRWSAEDGYRHEGVDSPEDKPGRSISAIFVADGVFDPDGIGARFASDAIEIPEVIRNFVQSKISGYAPDR